MEVELKNLNELNSKKVSFKDKKILSVTVVQAKNVPSIDQFAQSNTFVSIMLESDQMNKKTNIVRNENNPKWDKRFAFGLTDEKDKIVLTLYQFYVKNIPLSEIIIPLEELDLYEKEEFEFWINLPLKITNSFDTKIRLIFCAENFGKKGKKPKEKSKLINLETKI